MAHQGCALQNVRHNPFQLRDITSEPVQVTVCQPPSSIPIPVWPFAAELQQLWERSQVDTSASVQLQPAIEADDVTALQVRVV